MSPEKNLSEINLTPKNLADLTRLIDQGEISSKIAKTVFSEMLVSRGNPLKRLLKKKALKQITDEKELGRIVETCLIQIRSKLNSIVREKQK